MLIFLQVHFNYCFINLESTFGLQLNVEHQSRPKEPCFTSTKSKTVSFRFDLRPSILRKRSKSRENLGVLRVCWLALVLVSTFYYCASSSTKVLKALVDPEEIDLVLPRIAIVLLVVAVSLALRHNLWPKPCDLP